MVFQVRMHGVLPAERSPIGEREDMCGTLNLVRLASCENVKVGEGVLKGERGLVGFHAVMKSLGQLIVSDSRNKTPHMFYFYFSQSSTQHTISFLTPDKLAPTVVF